MDKKILAFEDRLKPIAFANHYKEDAVGSNPIEFRLKCILCGYPVYFGEAAAVVAEEHKAFDPRDPNNELTKQIEIVIGKECMTLITGAFIMGVQQSIAHQETVERES